MTEYTEEINKVSAVWHILEVVFIFICYFIILNKYIIMLQTLDSEILVFIGIVFFIYLSMGRLFAIISNRLSEIRYINKPIKKK